MIIWAYMKFLLKVSLMVPFVINDKRQIFTSPNINDEVYFENIKWNNQGFSRIIKMPESLTKIFFMEKSMKSLGTTSFWVGLSWLWSTCLSQCWSALLFWWCATFFIIKKRFVKLKFTILYKIISVLMGFWNFSQSLTEMYLGMLCLPDKGTKPFASSIWSFLG